MLNYLTKQVCTIKAQSMKTPQERSLFIAFFFILLTSTTYCTWKVSNKIYCDFYFWGMTSNKIFKCHFQCWVISLGVSNKAFGTSLQTVVTEAYYSVLSVVQATSHLHVQLYNSELANNNDLIVFSPLDSEFLPQSGLINNDIKLFSTL